MKFSYLLLIPFLFSSQTYAMDTHEEQKKPSKKRSEVTQQLKDKKKSRKIVQSTHEEEKKGAHSKKRSRSPDSQDETPAKRLKNQSSPSPDSSELSIEDFKEIYYNAPACFETNRLFCVRIKDKEEELASYQLVFNDDPNPPAWSVNQYGSMEEAEEFLDLKEKFGVYDKFSSFSDYNMYLKANEGAEDEEADNTPIGRFGLYHRHPSYERLEVSDYIASPYRGKGYGKEANKGFIEQVILPGVGKPFFMVGTNDNSVLPEPENTSQGIWSSLRHKLTFPCECSTFKGIEAIIDLDNTASLAVSLASGYFPVLANSKAIVFVPPLHQSPMSSEDMQNLRKISEAWQSFTPILEEKKISLQRYLKNVVPIEERNDLKNLYINLLNSAEPFTFYSALTFLKNDLETNFQDMGLNHNTAISKLQELLVFFETLDLGRFLSFAMKGEQEDCQFILSRLQKESEH